MTVSTSPSPEVGQPDEIPLSIEPVLGWRVWHLVRQNEQLRLHALSHPDTWTPQEATAARCSRTPHEGAPVESCTCGYYAASSMENLAASGVFGRGVGVVGAIAMWGRVIEHARGARSEYAYPARLRLVCGPCLEQGQIVDPISVVEDTWLIPLCDRHWRSKGSGQAPASAVQAELLATYGVELLPRPRLPRLSHKKLAEISAGQVLGWVFLAIFQVIRFVIGAFIALWLIGTALAVVGVVVGAVVGAVSGPASPSPSAMASAPPLSHVHADRTVEHHRRLPSVPIVPRFAIKCGISHGTWIEFAPCSSPDADLLGLAERTRPRGVARDCPPDPDAYSHGDDWNVCWLAQPGTWVSPTATSPNPFPHARK
jgi:hypothetical protein